jgi:hypothetical protein
MKNQIVNSRSAISKIYAALIVVIVVVAGVAGVYYLALPKDNNPSGQAIANFRAGAYVEYLLKSFDNNGSLFERQAKWSVDEGTYNGTDCWLLIIDNSETSTEGVKSEVILTLYLSKGSLERVHIKSQMFLAGDLIFEDESETDSTEFNDIIPTQFPAQYVAYETVTVLAGTFTGCAKVSDTQTGSVFNAWVHEDVPVWGIVKMESYEGETLVTSMELKAYG